LFEKSEMNLCSVIFVLKIHCTAFNKNQRIVKISDIINLTNARIVTSQKTDDINLDKAFSSDLMSDVLTLDEDNILLITGLANVQLVRTAEMADIRAILLARDKKATPEMICLAEENEIILLESPFSIFRASGVLFSNGIKPVY
jgi:hypothetical protein